MWLAGRIGDAPLQEKVLLVDRSLNLPTSFNRLSEHIFLRQFMFAELVAQGTFQKFAR